MKTIIVNGYRLMVKEKIVICLLALLVVLTMSCGREATVREVSLVPEPVFMVQKEGSFALHRSPRMSVVNVGQNSATVKHIMKSLRQLHLRPKLVSATEDFDIELLLYDTLNSELGDEGYLLEIRPSGIRLSANSESGLLYAYQTFSQLLPTNAGVTHYSKVVLPECTILDYPCHDQRGLHLSLEGYVPSVKPIKKLLDLLSSYKMNSLALTGGRWEADSSMWVVDSVSTLSLQEVEELVAYGASMGVTVTLDSDAAQLPPHEWDLSCYQADSRYQPLAAEGVMTLQMTYTDTADKSMCLLRFTPELRPPEYDMEYMLLPRLLAVSERLWTVAEKRDWNRFRRKVEEHKERLAGHGYNYCEGSFTPRFAARRVDGQTMNISIGTEVPNTYIFYTTDLSTPTRNSAVYIGPVNLQRGAHIKILPVYKNVDRDSVYEFVIK